MNKSMLILSATLVYLALISSFAGAEKLDNRIFTLELHYESANLTFSNLTFSYGFSPDRNFQPQTGYKIDVVSFDKKILYSFRFDIPNKLVQLPPLSGQEAGSPEIMLDKVDFALIIPYFTDSEKINVYDPTGRLLFSVDVRRYAQPDAAKREESGRFSLPSFPIEILAGMAIIILAALFFLFRKKSSPQTEPANL